MAPQEDVIKAGLKAALDLAAETPWADLRLSDIAARAGLPLEAFHGTGGKAALADAVEALFDPAMSAEGIDPEDSPRERLFDVIMLRFEAMEPYRAGLVSLMAWRRRAPVARARLALARQRTAEWALVSAGLDGERELPLAVKALALAVVLERTERAWQGETDAGLARTMAALDEGLRTLEKRLARLQGLRGRRRQARDAADTPAPSEPRAGDPSEMTMPEAGDGPAGPQGETPRA